LKAISSVMDTFKATSEFLIRYENTQEMRLICSKYIGRFIYESYPTVEPIMSKIDELFKFNELKLILLDRKVLNVLRILLGW
jgi:hypothetical protein